VFEAAGVEDAERIRRDRADADAVIWAELWRMVTTGRVF
jgi:hypothetical protein